MMFVLSSNAQFSITMKHYFFLWLFSFTLTQSWAQYSPEKLKEIKQKASKGDTYSIWLTGKFHEEGSNGYQQSYLKAIKLFEQVAKSGFDSASFELGRIYQKGLGVNADSRKAFEFYQKAATSGKHAQASFAVAEMQFNGEGTEKNPKQAVNTYLMLWRKFGLTQAREKLVNIDVPAIADTSTTDYIYYMANLGNPYYEYRLAKLYEEGREFPRSTSQAFSYYKKAGDLGYLPAILEVANCYDGGIGTPPNKELAVDFYLKASNMGSIEAKNKLKNYNLDEFLKPNEVAYLQYKAENGQAAEMFILSEKYASGNGVPRNLSQSVELLEKSASLDYLPAVLKLASYYEKGELVPRNDSIAFKMYRKGAFLNNDTARFMLAEMLISGRGCKQDTRLAVNQYLLAANNGHELARLRLKQIKLKEFISPTDIQYLRYVAQTEPNNKDAIYNLGNTYLKANDPQGIIWLKRAAELGHSKAQAIIGEIYLNGSYNVPQDLNTAFRFLVPLAQNGHLNALVTVARTYNQNMMPAGFSGEAFIKVLIAANAFLSNPKNFEKPDTLHLDFCKQYANIYLQEKDFSNVTFYLNKYDRIYDDTLNKPLEIINVYERTALAYLELEMYREAIYNYDRAIMKLDEFSKHPDILPQYTFLKRYLLGELAKAQHIFSEGKDDGACNTLRQAQDLGMNIQTSEFANICKN